MCKLCIQTTFLPHFLLQSLLMLKVTLLKDGAIYFGEISLFPVNRSSLIAGFKSSPQITYLIIYYRTQPGAGVNFAHKYSR